MKHIIIGTAGHIDHGKTTLIKAITGRDTDRLKEEQKRGISIELGFTYFDLPSGQRAGIIDVPGHERFIKNMLAGVIGIDIVLLVVAADEGMMPQTLEHLAILDLLGIKNGFVVITKTDLVDDEWIDLVEEEIKHEIKGSFLEDKPLIRVSSTKCKGIKDIIDLLEKSIYHMEDRNPNEIPRLPVDRAFLMPGFGTIVTGTLLSGSFKIGDEVQAYPGEKTARIRTLQVHDEDAEIAYGGQRVAMNLAGLKKNDLDRGSTIAPIGSMNKTILLDVKVRLLKSLDRNIDNRTRLKLYLGSKEVLCRIVLLDRDELSPGQEAFAQLRLEEEVVARRHDKFILRFYSPMFTIGGGEILEPNPRKKKRFDEEGIKELEIKSQGDPIEIIEKIIEDKSKDFPTTKDLAIATSLLEENLDIYIEELFQGQRILRFILTKDVHIIHSKYFDRLRAEIINKLEEYHNKYPLRKGISKEEVRSTFIKDAKPRLGEMLIDRLIEDGYLEQEKEFMKIKGFKINYDKSQEEIKNKIINIMRDKRFTPPRRDEILGLTAVRDVDFDEVYNSLIIEGLLLRLTDDLEILKEVYDDAVDKINGYFRINKEITVAEFRDLLDTNRKTALGLLENFDKERITKRSGDKRVLY